MDATVPTAEDHCRIQILVKMLGHRSTTTFNHLMKSLSKVEATDVSENPKRIILAKFVTNYNPELTKFGDLQAHRKIFGFIGVAQTSNATNVLAENNRRASSVGSNRSTESLDVDNNSHSQLVRKTSSTDGSDSIENIKELYLHQKEELNGSLVDSRCVLLGFNDTEDSGIEQRELINYTTQEEFESEVRELIRSIYFVLESRRLDLSFEKMDQPPCPIISEEEKTRVGTENKGSKIYKKKCVGRMRKQVGDYSLLTGLPSLASDAYIAAIEYLKSASDLLWLAAAYEGLSCAAMSIKYNETENRLRKQAVIHRVSTMTPDELRDHQEKTQHTLGLTLGHQRYRSDDDQRAMATAAAAAAQLIEQDLQKRKQQTRKPWALLNMDRSPSGKLDFKEILEKFTLALENYVRFSFVAYVEYECMIRASSVYRYERNYLETDAFLREQVNKYLDDSFTLFDNIIKAQICVVYSQIYKEMGFHRKTAFYLRLAVLFRLHANDADSRTESDYKLVYPVLYKTLPGYGIAENTKETRKGPVSVQIKAMHEVYMSALRANLNDAAIRHLCYILQTFYDDLETGASLRMLDELHRLVSSTTKTHSLAQHLSLDQSGIMLPPLQMTKFPTLSDFKIVPLSSDLAPKVIPANYSPGVFIYSPFQNCDDSNEIYWITNCGCAISVKMLNPLPINLEIKNLILLTEGCTFEAAPVELTLPPYFEGTQSTEIKLTGIPRKPGNLTITGYSCEVLGVKNICSIKEIFPRNKHENNKENKDDKYTVEVLQELPLLVLESSLSKAPTIDDDVDPVAETTIFAGQTFEHSVTIENTSKTIAIKSLKIKMRQPTVYGSQLIELLDMEEDDDCVRKNERKINGLKPGEKREIKFNIFGIDPASITDEDYGGETKEKVLMKTATRTSIDKLDEENVDQDGVNTARNSIISFSDGTSLASTNAGTNQGNPDLIPYSGRLLTADIIFEYMADIKGPEGEEYERKTKLPLAVFIIPALTVSNYEVLASGSPWDRYVVIGVTNSTELDAELTYSFDQKKIGVQAGGGEPPMVPVLVPCCPNVSARTLREACQHDSQVRQKQEIDKLRRKLEPHIAKHLQISWRIPQLGFNGVVPIGSILAEVGFLKKLVVPTVSVDVIVNGNPTSNGKDITVKIGELVEMELIVFSVLKDKKPIKGEISLSCFQDLYNNLPPIDKAENMVICGPIKLPVTINPISTENDLLNGDLKKKTLYELAREDCNIKFSFLFLYEGKHKIRPVLQKSYQLNEPNLGEDEVFVPTIGFDVDNKNS